MNILGFLVVLIAYDSVRFLFQRFLAPRLSPRVVKVLQFLSYGVTALYVLSLLGVLPIPSTVVLSAIFNTSYKVVDWWGLILLLFGAVGLVETGHTLAGVYVRGNPMLDPTQVQLYAILIILVMAAFGFGFSAFATTITNRPLDPNVQANVDRLIGIAIGIAIGAGSTAYVNRVQREQIIELKAKVAELEPKTKPLLGSSRK